MTLGRKAFRSVRKNLSFYLVTCFLMMKYTGKYYRIEIPLRCKERASDSHAV